jgi:hypothetical protein
MSSAQERIKVLALEIKKATKEARTAEARARALGEELVRLLPMARAEAEAARTIVEYPVGRYECKGCRQGTIFSQAYRELPACDNCGGHEYSGPEPKVITITPPPPCKYSAGMYECGACHGRVVVAEDTNELSPCDLCGAGQLSPL